MKDPLVRFGVAIEVILMRGVARAAKLVLLRGTILANHATATIDGFRCPVFVGASKRACARAGTRIAARRDVGAVAA